MQRGCVAELRARMTSILVMTFLAFAAWAVPGASALRDENGNVQITFLQLNDVYQTSPVDRGTHGGLARVATLRKHIRLQIPDAIFVLAGDTLSPSVASQLFKGRQMISAWNALNLDYATFGNHEFDFGPFEFLERMKDSKFHWICANVIDKDSGSTFGQVSPYVIRDIDGVKVGIIGFLTPDTVNQSRPGPRIAIEDPVKIAQKYIPEMKAKGAQVIVGLTHLTIAQDQELAKAAPFDLIMGGHEHYLINAYAGHAPILKMGSDARYLGKIQVSFSTKKNAVENIVWEVMPVNSELKEDPDMLKAIHSYDDELAKELDHEIGTSTVPLDAVQANNETKETNLGNFVADAFRKYTGADVCLVNGGSIRSNQIYAEGALKKRDVLAILPFENPVVKIEVTGAVLKEALENGVSKAGAAAGRFPQVSGLSFSYDTTLPPGSRVTRVLVNGAPLDQNKSYTLAGNDYLTSGGDGYLMLRGRKYLIKPEEGKSESVILLEALTQGKIAPAIDGRITRINPLTAAEGAHED